MLQQNQMQLEVALLNEKVERLQSSLLCHQISFILEKHKACKSHEIKDEDDAEGGAGN